MKRMNNWLAQIRTRSRRKHILHCTHAKIIVHVSPVAGWQQAVSSTTWPHLQFTPAMARYICSIKFFHLKMTLGLAFGESWLLLAQPRTNTDVYKGLFAWEGLGPRLHGILQTQQNLNSYFSLHCGSRDWIYQASFQDTLQHSTTLKWLTMVSNLAHPQLLSCEHSPCPHPMLTASFLVSSYVSFQLSAGEIGLDQLRWTWNVAEPIPLHTKTSPVEQQFPVHLQLKESKVGLSCSRDFD